MRRRVAVVALCCAGVLVASGRRASAAEDQVLMTPPPVGAPVPPATGPGATPVSPLPSAVAAATTGPAGAPAPVEKKQPAGWIPGSGFVLQSEDAAFKLRIGLQAAYKFEPVYQAGSWQERNTFFVLRPSISGNFFKEWIHFWTSFEFAANPPYLLDSYVEIFPYKEFGLRIGQQFTPFDRHEYLGPQEILMPEWAPVSEYFWTGRDKGVTAMGALFESKLEYWAGLYSGTPLRQFNALPGNYVVEGRVTWSPLGSVASVEFPYIVTEGPTPLRISFTMQGYYGKVQSAIENFNPSTFSFQSMPSGETRKQGAGGADMWIYNEWFAFYMEGMVRQTEPPMGAKYTSGGLWMQASGPLIAKTMDLAARFNYLNPSTDLANDNFYSIEGQLAYYFMHTPNLVLKLRYGYGHQDTVDMAQQGPVTLVLSTPGRIQLFTIQLNLMF